MKDLIKHVGCGDLDAMHGCGLCDQIRESLCAVHPEICICAAVRLSDGRIIRGHRHSDCLRIAQEWKDAGQVIWFEGSAYAAQGFMTSRNRFVGRAEGMRLQKAAGARSAYSPDGTLTGEILFSEDLY